MEKSLIKFNVESFRMAGKNMEQTQHRNINREQRKQTVAFAVGGGIIIAVILLLTTVWVMNSAGRGTRQAVSRVSEFYLDELAGRRAQVVAEELKNHFLFMENALDIMEESNLESQQSLRRFLGKMKRLYRMNKFALVDEAGIVYTEHSTTSGLSRYSFLTEDLTGPAIHTANLYGARKQVILVMPVEDIVFQGTPIKVCFVQLDIDEMLSSLILKTSDNETFSNLFYKNGESLTNDGFGHLTSENNLLSALADAEIDEGFSIAQVKKDFEEGRRGQISFRYQGVKEDLSYIPVEGTDWMLTILIRDNVISDQISSISVGMMRRSIIQIAITIIAMLGVFSVFVYQFRKNTSLVLAQEKADGNKIRAAYAQIEREQEAMNNIQTAMGSGFWSMEFNEHAQMVSCTWSETFREMLGYTGKEDFPNRLESWSDLLHEEDKKQVLKEYWDTVMDYSGEKNYDVEYRLLTRHLGWRWFHAAGRLSRRDDGSPISFVGMFMDIDDEKRMAEQLERQKIDLQDALAAAQHANRAKTTFLNNMSHDIRTPMNAIIGFTSLAVTHLDNREQVQDVSAYLQDALKEGKTILLEGQLGSLKDPDHGIYPMVTSSSTLAAYGAIGAGIPPYEIKDIITVVKAYSSAVGAGAFVSEIFGDEADELRRRGGDGGEFGATTGRPRRMGWFDAVATRYGCRIQGATEVAFTVLDVLGYLDELPVCVGYEIDGKVTKDFPTTVKLAKAKPVYTTLPGWKCDIRGIKNYEELPENCRKYIEFIEKEIQVPITMVSNGPGRDDIIHRVSK